MTNTWNKDATGCDAPLDRPRYFTGQLITADTLSQEQDYFRQRMRLHNRMLWGWGTVCGAEVCRVPINGEWEPWLVKITPGYLLGPYGDEILIGAQVVVDLRTAGLDGAAGVAPEQSAADPWCSQVCLPREPGPLYLAVRYKECATRPVRVEPAGCGCDTEACEYSVLRDGFEVGVLDDCPDSHHDPDAPGATTASGIPECPPCPEDPWVVLACINVDENGIVDEPGNPDNCVCRRIVVSNASTWWQCEPAAEPPAPAPGPVIDRIEAVLASGQLSALPVAVAANDIVTLRIAGSGFGENVTLELASGFALQPPLQAPAPGQLQATVQVLGSAAPGVYGLKLVRADGETAATENVFKVAGLVQPHKPINEVRFRSPENGAFTSSELKRGDVVIVQVTAEEMPANARLEVPAGYELSDSRIEGDKLIATLKVPQSAALGEQPLRVIGADGEVLAERQNAFTVKERG